MKLNVEVIINNDFQYYSNVTRLKVAMFTSIPKLKQVKLMFRKGRGNIQISVGPWMAVAKGEGPIVETIAPRMARSCLTLFRV